MGSLLLAGAIGGAGTGIQENVRRNNQNEQNSLDRQHDERLAEMRSKSATSLQKTSQDYQTTAATTLEERRVSAQTGEREYQESITESEREYQASLVGATQQREDFVRGEEDEQERFLQAMKSHDAMLKSGNYTTSDGKYEMQIITDIVMNPITGLPQEQDRLVVREPGTPYSYVQHGLAMVPDNISQEELDEALTYANVSAPKQGEEADPNYDKVQLATADLLKGAGTDNDQSSAFIKKFGYLPTSYFRKVRFNDERDGNSFRKYYQQFQAPTPPTGNPNNPEGLVPTTDVPTVQAPNVSGQQTPLAQMVNREGFGQSNSGLLAKGFMASTSRP